MANPPKARATLAAGQNADLEPLWSILERRMGEAAQQREQMDARAARVMQDYDRYRHLAGETIQKLGRLADVLREQQRLGTLSSDARTRYLQTLESAEALLTEAQAEFQAAREVTATFGADALSDLLGVFDSDAFEQNDVATDLLSTESSAPIHTDPAPPAPARASQDPFGLAALLAATLRLASVFLLSTFVVTSMAREGADKGLELLLALPMPRAAYLLGKLLGYGALAAVPAVLSGLLMALFAPPAHSALWGASLLGELWIVAAFSLLCAASLQQPLPALAAAGGFYVLARMVGSLQLLAHGAQAGHAWPQRAMAGAIDVLALLLPRLDDFTRTEWLLYATGDWHALGRVAAQTCIYVALLAAGALCDFYRRNI